MVFFCQVNLVGCIIVATLSINFANEDGINYFSVHK